MESDRSINKSIKKEKPVMKLSCAVAKLFFEKVFIWPFKALCTPTQLPAKTAKVIARNDKSFIANLSQADITTAPTVIIAAITRRFEITDLTQILGFRRIFSTSRVKLTFIKLKVSKTQHLFISMLLGIALF